MANFDWTSSLSILDATPGSKESVLTSPPRNSTEGLSCQGADAACGTSK